MFPFCDCGSEFMRHVYGPLRSWLSERSIGIDPIGTEPKVCNFNCIYCRLGRKGILMNARTKFASSKIISEELSLALRKFPSSDSLIFAGTGEPTLALNFGEIVDVIRSICDLELGIITNATLLDDLLSRNEVAGLNFIIAKLDAVTDVIFKTINEPHRGISITDILDQIQSIRKHYNGRFYMVITLIEENLKEVPGFVDFCNEIKPEVLFLDTPMHCKSVASLGRRRMRIIQSEFEGLSTLTVYERFK